MFRNIANTAAKALGAMVLITMASAVSAQDVEIADMQIGNPDASVTVVEYASYTCPHCANFHKNQFVDLKANYIDTGKINFVYREVYFDRYGLWASMVARCDADKFFGISDLIYKGQSEWAKGTPAEIADNLRKIGRVAGLSEEQLDVCLTDADKAQGLFAWYQANAEADDISSTPTFMINGQQYSNMNYSEFAAIIDEKLAE